MSLLPKRASRIIISILIVYVVWSALVRMTGAHRAVSDDALIPCLFLLPPIGILAVAYLVPKAVILVGYMLWRKKKKAPPHGGSGTKKGTPV